jgi:deoxyribodipyrimidine photolyase-related protein
MACMKACIGQVLDSGFGHHIQRLMVTGNFALISGVHPRAVSDWYLGMFIDGVDWVTLPNALGMVMHADRRSNAPKGVTGLVGTKPYAASGKYIERMSNYCTTCRYDPSERSGTSACPFTVFYWDFLIRNRAKLAPNQRMSMILNNLERMTPEARTQLTIDAELLRRKLGITIEVRE